MNNSMSAIMSLLGGTAFRLVLGFIFELLRDWQSHRFEVERMRVMSETEDHKHKRDVELAKLHKELGIEVVGIEREGHAMTEASLADVRSAMDLVSKPSGNKVIDIWNSAVRPGLATFCITVWGLYLYQKGWVLGPWDLELIAATLGIFIGSRISSTGR